MPVVVGGDIGPRQNPYERENPEQIGSRGFRGLRSLALRDVANVKLSRFLYFWRLLRRLPLRKREKFKGSRVQLNFLLFLDVRFQ